MRERRGGEEPARIAAGLRSRAKRDRRAARVPRAAQAALDRLRRRCVGCCCSSAAIVFVDTMFFVGADAAPAALRGRARPVEGRAPASSPRRIRAGALVGGIPSGHRDGALRRQADGARRPRRDRGDDALRLRTAEAIWLLDLARFLQGFASALLVDRRPRVARRRGAGRAARALIGAAMAAAIVGALFGPVLGAAALGGRRRPTFGGVGLLRRSASRRGPLATRALARARRRSRSAVLLAALRSRRIAARRLVRRAARRSSSGRSACSRRCAWTSSASAAVAIGGDLARPRRARGDGQRRSSDASPDRVGRLLPLDAGSVLAAGIVVALFPLAEQSRCAVRRCSSSSPASRSEASGRRRCRCSPTRPSTRGLDYAYAFALINLAWAPGRASAPSGGGALAEVTSDAVPYLLLAALLRAYACRAVAIASSS